MKIIAYIKKTQKKISNLFHNYLNLYKTKDIFIIPKLKVLMDNKIIVKGMNNSINLANRASLKNSTITIYGNNNKIQIKANSIFHDTKITIWGNNSELHIEENCENKHGNLTLNLENDGTKILIGKNNHFYYGEINISVQENARTITIGDNCVISHHVDIRTSDSHSIIDKTTGKRINYGENIKIGNHVWITPYVTILKGSEIQDDSVIGTKSLVSRKFEKNGVIAGIPAKLIKENITWTTENIK